MTRYRTGLDTASALPIAALATKCNRVMRLAAFSLVQSQKAGIWTRITRQVAFMLPAKSKSTKRLAASKVADVARVTRPLMRLIGCQFRYTVFECHNDNKRPRQTVGAKFEPLYGWLVNATECANRLTRLHCTSSGLNG